ncbi:MAG TPA: serine/threonine-protein phosphatase, partial [Fuerstia sp.]|nr:serine/threonine-protein phosphatase [Fuerstiella sp.]
MSSVSDFPVPELAESLFVRAGGGSVRGTSRERNEDCCVIDSHQQYFVIADGIGGSAGGEVASRMACDILDEEIGQLVQANEFSARSQFAFLVDRKEQIRVQLLAAMRTANIAIISERQCSWRQCRMGTTAIAAVVIDEDLYLASIGDSRACLVRDGVIQRLTSDHTMTAGLVNAGLLSPEEAATHQYRNVLYKYLGAWPDRDPADVVSFTIRSGDCLVLATDGLTDYVTEEEIAAVCGHIGDCGQAFTKAKCPECGEEIGGGGAE